MICIPSLRCVLIHLAVVLLGWGSGSLYAQAQDIPPHTVVADTFRADDGTAVPVERGTFRVPENRSDASPDSISLGYVRFPSTAENPGPPIVYLAGGPGGSGTRAASGDRFPLFQALRAVGDVIAFDQRGTGTSNDLARCPHGWSLPADRPASRAAVLAAVRDAAGQCRRFWDSTGTDLAAYTTLESADDLDALRRVLGAESLTLWGISYGTHLGLAMMKRHPDRVHRAIFAGLEPLDNTDKLPSDQQRLLERIDAMVRTDSLLRTKMPDLLGTMEAVLTELEDRPVTTAYVNPRTGQRDTVVVGRFDMQVVTASLLRGPESIAAIPQVYADAARGDFRAVASRVDGWPRSGGFWTMSAGMDAASGASDARRARIAEERVQTLLGDAINAPYLTEAANALGVADLGPSFRLPVSSDVPTLLISGTLDGRTPPSNAESVRAGLSASTHLQIDGAGHGDDLFLSHSQILPIMIDFLEDTPVRDTTLAGPPVTFPLRDPVAVPMDTLRRFEGTYEVEAWGRVTVSAHEGGLRLAVNRYGMTVVPASARTFYEPLDPHDTISFPADAEPGAEMVVRIDGTPHYGRRLADAE